MSSVRMCDRCGTVFSERADNWTTFTGSRTRRNAETGKTEILSETMDSCPECSQLLLTPQRPELTTTVTDVRQPTVRPSYETKEQT